MKDLGILRYHWVFALLGLGYIYLLADSVGGGLGDRARLCFAFNEYALAIIDGRLDLPPAAIGLEGFFTNDGKVLTYLAVLPAILRIPLIPFVDLSEICVARYMMLAYLILIGIICHATIVRVAASSLQTNGSGAAMQLGALLLLVLVWFASPLTILSSAAAQTYEPIALALLFTVAFIGVVVDDLLVKRRAIPHRLIILAVLAGVSVHTRVNVAVFLYAAVVLIAFVTLWNMKGVAGWGSVVGNVRNRTTAFYRVLAAMLVLGVFGLSLLGLNYGKWGTVGMTPPAGYAQYGYPLFVESKDSPRRLSGRTYKLGTFSWRRVPSNTVFHMAGAWELKEKLLDVFGGGYVRTAPPYAPTLLMWFPWYLSMFVILLRWKEVAHWAGERKAVLGILLLATLGISALILAYATVLLRYKVELWPLLYLSTLVAFGWVLERKQPEIIVWRRVASIGLGVLLAASVAWSIVYGFQVNRANASDAFLLGTFPKVECVWTKETGWSSDCAGLPD